MKKCKHKAGFTLIELIIAMAILAILATLSIPHIDEFIVQAQLSADLSTVRTINNATALTRIHLSSSDPFLDESNSSLELMEFLVDQGQLSTIVSAQSKDAEFEWISSDEVWVLLFGEHLYSISLSDGISFGLNYWSHTLIGLYTGSLKNIFIPDNIDGTSINQIYQDVFKNAGLLSVTFADESEITRIHARAFYNNELTQIDFPDTLTQIDLWAFKDNNLTEINLPESLISIQLKAFEGNDLEKITIGSNVTTIQTQALGSHTEQFIEAYLEEGAGTYLWDGENWVKQ